MQGKQKIIDDILASARSTAAGMVEEAQTEADAAASALKTQLDGELAAERERIAKAAESAYSGGVKLGELEAKKALLAARQACIAAVYDGVKKAVLSAPDAKYLDMLKKLIVETCEDGDEIICCAADAKRITADWVKKVSAAAKKKLTLSKERGDFSGGVILRNEKYDRSLTVDDIVEDLKERTLGETVTKLGL